MSLASSHPPQMELDASAPEPSDEVAVVSSDGSSRPATLLEEQDEQCLVEFGDRSRRWVPAAAVRR